jgi:hypothetical protein
MVFEAGEIGRGEEERRQTELASAQPLAATTAWPVAGGGDGGHRRLSRVEDGWRHGIAPRAAREGDTGQEMGTEFRQHLM